MKLAVIGTGYVGLVSGVCLAELGVDVTCIDNNKDKIDALNKGDVPIYEPGLDELITRNTNAGRLHFTTDLPSAVSQADVVMIAVGTPPHPDTGKADLKFVFGVAEELAPHLQGYTVIVTKSTVPVGTGQEVKRIISQTNSTADFDIASNPEFLREGSAIVDFMKPDRIIVGVEEDKAGYVLSDLYQPLTNKGYPLVKADIETSEMIKYASNSFLATKIAFINEMADICEQVGANVKLVAKGMGMDKRIGDRFLNPGPGFGGSCFPKDAMALAQLAEEHGVEPNIVNAVIHYNLNRRESMAPRVIDACGGDVKGKTIAILGLTFKANTDDMRESPSLSIIPALLDAGAIIKTYDPEGMENAKQLLSGNIEWCESLYDAIDASEAAVIVTEWDRFRNMDLSEVRERMAYPRIVDLRNLFAPSAMASKGFDYYSIGRKPALANDEPKLQRAI
ncbi:MAG: UDP-glucose/GDP-mannose dehydrogenase family protein [Rickettsiales bacterium]|nr:UDP-glucose/GDP-mannose dehydrogenase family protein [Rickettsiales bacterium]